MEYRQLGRSDLEVSSVCLGTMTYGTPVAEAEAIELTHWAIDHGINFIDTANMYEGYNRYLGSPGGVAEDILGKALAGRRDRIVLATKVGNPVGEGADEKGLGRAHVLREIDRSLRRLRTDYVDVYYMHRPDPETPLAESLAVFNELVDCGKARHIGFSNYDAAGIAEILKVCDEEGLRRPVVSQPPCSLLKREAETDELPLCEREGIAAVPYQILQGGLLTGKYSRAADPPSGSRMEEKPEWLAYVSGDTYDQLDVIGQEAKAAGLTMMQYAVTWALSRPAVASVIVGAKRSQQIADVIAAAAMAA